MRNLNDELLTQLTYKNISVRGLDNSSYLELTRLKRENNPHLREWMVERKDSSKSTDRITYGIYYQDDLVGEVTLKDFTPLTCQIAYWLHQPLWGLGITTTAVRLVSEYALENLNVLEVVAYVHYLNESSAHVLRKVGYNEVDTVYKKMYYQNKKDPHIMFTYDKISSR